MNIDVPCDGCGRVYRLDSQHAGKRMRCKGCGHKITIPAANAAADHDDDDLIPLAPVEVEPAARAPRARGAAPTFAPTNPGAAPVPPPLPRGAGFAPRAPVPVVPVVEEGADDAAYVTLSHEAAVDRFVPFAIVGLFLLVLIVLATRVV